MTQNTEQNVRTRREQLATYPETVCVGRYPGNSWQIELDGDDLDPDRLVEGPVLYVRCDIAHQSQTEADARGAEEQRRDIWEEIKRRCYIAFSKVKVGDIIAFAHPQTDRIKAFCPYSVVPNNPDKPYDLVRFPLYGEFPLYQQNAQSWRDDGGYIIHSPANVAALEARVKELEAALAAFTKIAVEHGNEKVRMETALVEILQTPADAKDISAAALTREGGV